MKLSNKIEAILFFKAEPMSVSAISKILNVSEEDVRSAISEMKNTTDERGIILLEKNGVYMLGTHPDISPVIEKITKEELSRDLTKAAMETLSVILYKGSVTRSDIDYVRGVNSSFILRNLQIRGLVDRETNPKDSRSYIYKPSFELLSYLGISSLEELPDRERALSELQSFEETLREEEASQEQKEVQEELTEEENV